MLKLLSVDFFFQNKFFQENYLSLKQFGYRYGANLFAKIIGRKQNLLFAEVTDFGGIKVIFIEVPQI